MHILTMCALRKIANYARRMGMHTPSIALQSVIAARRMELLHEVISSRMEESPAKTEFKEVVHANCSLHGDT